MRYNEEKPAVGAAGSTRKSDTGRRTNDPTATLRGQPAHVKLTFLEWLADERGGLTFDYSTLVGLNRAGRGRHLLSEAA